MDVQPRISLRNAEPIIHACRRCERGLSALAAFVAISRVLPRTWPKRANRRVPSLPLSAGPVLGHLEGQMDIILETIQNFSRHVSNIARIQMHVWRVHCVHYIELCPVGMARRARPLAQIWEVIPSTYIFITTSIYQQYRALQDVFIPIQKWIFKVYFTDPSSQWGCIISSGLLNLLFLVTRSFEVFFCCYRNYDRAFYPPLDGVDLRMIKWKLGWASYLNEALP